MYRNINFGILAAAMIVVSPGQADSTSPSKYSGQESRAIKSLSADDIEELRSGGGWGLAKSAELNGVPGPAHLLELKDELSLSRDQINDITAIFASMQAEAIRHGENLIQLEWELEQEFRNATVTADSLKAKLGEISETRGELRFVHLATHLKTPELLTPAQLARYNGLRGYADDPCTRPPTGHDPVLWRKHNGCQ